MDILHGRPQYLCHAPSLRNTANWTMRRVSLEDFRNVSQASVGEMLLQRCQPCLGLAACRIASAVYLIYAVMKGPISQGQTVP